MPLPDLAANISEIAVAGVPIRTEDFPRIRSRRIPAQLGADDEYDFDKKANQTVDFAVDATLVFDFPDEALISAYAWSSDPTDLEIVSCRFTNRAIMVNVSGGTDGQSYVINLHGQTQKGRALQWCANVNVFGTGHAGAASDLSYPRIAYLEDCRGEVIWPAYADCRGDPLSVPL